MEPGQVVRAYHGKENNRKKPWAVVMAVLILLAVVILESRMGLIPDQNGGTVQEQTEQMPTGEMAVIAEAENPPKTSDDVLPDDAVEELPSEETADAELSTVEPAAVSSPAVTYTYNFRKAEYLQEHFVKHGAEFGYASAEEYLAGANRVIASADVLHKLEAEDGDDVYYLEATNEFVIVSTDGFLRTYFKPEDGKAYFDRQ